MKQWKIGVLGAADIAFKRFLPALQKSDRFIFAGIASRSCARCEPFTARFGGRCYPDYHTLLKDPAIDCVYVPLPPALHAQWGEQVLKAGKHLLLEKPFTTTLEDTDHLLAAAERQQLAVHENYMFLYHSQMSAVKKIMEEGTLGGLRMIRSAFTFPYRGAQDFRYDPNLGGGALLDCGGYPLRLVSELLGSSVHLLWAGLRQDSVHGVDTSGSAVLCNAAGLTAHIFFGMDDTYRCELEVWGSKASLTASRIFTAPPELEPPVSLHGAGQAHTVQIGADDQFLNSINVFADQMEMPKLRPKQAEAIRQQSRLIQTLREAAGKEGASWEKSRL